MEAGGQRLSRGWGPVLLLAALAWAVAGMGRYLGLIEPFELKAFDLQSQLVAAGSGQDPRILVVAVDQRSIDHFQRDHIPFPWPRSLYAPIVRFARDAGARAVQFDILFNNLSPYGPEVDEEFAAGLAEAGGAWLAAGFSRGPVEATAAIAAIEPGGAAPPVGVPFDGPLPAELARTGASLPLATLRAAAGVGFVTQGPDGDGIYRRINPFIAYQGRLVPALGLAPLVTPADRIRLDGQGAHWAGRELPLSADGSLVLRYRGGVDRFRRVSAMDVIAAFARQAAGEAPALSPELFRDAYVFVAYTAPGLYDFKPTPVSSLAPGVFIHATLLADALDGDFIRTLDPLWGALAAALLALGVTAATLLPARVRVSAAFSVSLLLGFVGLVHGGFRAGLWGPLAYPLLAAGLGLLLASAYRYHTETLRRRHIQEVFGHYLAREVVDQIVASPRPPELGGERREITVLFSDLQGFTTLSERLDPHRLVQVLNDYTTLMADTIMANQGTVDKFIGDAVMAFWGAPLANARQSELALRTALECQRRFRDHFAGEYPDIEMSVRIGIDRGPCIVGNMGARQRFDYTAIGDTVNQAARLEGLNKHYHTRILAGEQAWGPAAAQFVGRRIDHLKVKGKSQPVTVYEVMAEDEAGDAARCRDYEAAFAAYLARRWDAAEAGWAGLAEGGDAPAQVMLERVRGYRRSPPPAEWDGAFEHHSK